MRSEGVLILVLINQHIDINELTTSLLSLLTIDWYAYPV